MFGGLKNDLVYILRSWRHAKAFALTSILTVALGLGLNAGIFAFADGFLFRPLPFANADELYAVLENGTLTGGVNLDDFDQIERTRPGLAGIAEWTSGLASQLQVGEGWVPVSSYAVSPRFEDVMGFRLLLGRGFRDDEHQPLSTTPCWVSYDFWQGKLGADARRVGTHLTIVGLDGKPADVEIVGVLPPLVASFDLNNVPPDLWFPAVPQALTGRQRQFSSALPIVRLDPGGTTAVVRGRLQALVDAVQASVPGGPHRTILLRPLREMQVRGGRATAWLLLAIALSILGLVVVNLGHLLLARAVARSSKIRLRLALGASRWRVMRLLLAESLAVAGAGLALGLGLGWALASIVRTHTCRATRRVSASTTCRSSR